MHRFFKEVLYAIGELSGEMIREPSTATPTKIQNSRRWFPFFKVLKRFKSFMKILAKFEFVK